PSPWGARSNRNRSSTPGPLAECVESQQTQRPCHVQISVTRSREEFCRYSAPRRGRVECVYPLAAFETGCCSCRESTSAPGRRECRGGSTADRCLRGRDRRLREA